MAKRHATVFVKQLTSGREPIGWDPSAPEFTSRDLSWHRSSGVQLGRFEGHYECGEAVVSKTGKSLALNGRTYFRLGLGDLAATHWCLDDFNDDLVREVEDCSCDHRHDYSGKYHASSRKD